MALEFIVQKGARIRIGDTDLCVAAVADYIATCNIDGVAHELREANRLRLGTAKIEQGERPCTTRGQKIRMRIEAPPNIKIRRLS